MSLAGRKLGSWRHDRDFTYSRIADTGAGTRLCGGQPISFTLTDRHAAYGWMADTLTHFSYARCKRANRGLLRQYLTKVTGLSRAQVTRCIAQFVAGGTIRDRRHAPAVAFERRYTAQDICLLAQVDALHGTLSGTTTRKLCERAFKVHGDARFERLAGISNGHLYNPRLRGGRLCANTRPMRTCAARSTRPARPRSISASGAVPHRAGVRAICVWTACSRAIWMGSRGAYLINAVDEVTQTQVICAVERISEAYLLPVLKAIMGVSRLPFAG